ncbi:60S acidic ribosomal subunit protein, putative [Trypanosoma brucei gambiense DAL972]|uniref:60S acidic ribosomal protein P0 n=1 Tax=Trypanosoma brucei gambiense (strain MHOM/CI/86/DAL972) TaxID=679716 RepID=D0A607_TRYB9|nr:60S acidic ribosomal subunit protein, putative [Trypanosoma brucei gambiense DAL972]CBH17108.1 60S acidic ribosomal subunit protein, putative [Trypanosoma brucei gambiense DAL972]|eukprot:XP_011779372.1 60S acidic ribosomal subunit protein, putative [Trypanosoma brucei gambiense DAL972]
MPSVSQEKRDYEDRLNGCLTKYSRVLFCLMDNVRSQQVHGVRRDLRGKGELVMGKKTLQKKIVEKRAEGNKATDADKLFHQVCTDKQLLCGNTSMIFTNSEVSDITSVLDSHRVQAPARVGAIAPCDVIVPAGNTGMEPKATAFFQALNIATKISKGTVEIVSDKKVLSTGDKVDNSTATLLQKLDISPFYYQVEVQSVWDRGVLFTREDLSVTDAVVEKYLLEGISNISAMSLGAGIPTAATLPHMIVDAFKTLLGASVATNYEFDEYDGKNLRTAALEGKLGGGEAAAPAAAAAAAAPTAAAPAAAAAEEEEDDDDFGMGALF